MKYDCTKCLHEDSGECEECTNTGEDGCSCHTNPPCSYCVGNRFEEKPPVTDLVKTIDIDLMKDICVVVSENDCSDWMLSDGAIVHETYTGKARLWNAVERAKNLDRYGRVQICKLVPLGTVEECERRCK